MKKLILVFAVIAITAGAYTQTDSTNRKMSQYDINNNQYQNIQDNPVEKSLPDGVLMQNGLMMMVKDGQMTILDSDTIISNGTRIMSDGTCIHKDGTKMMLEEGQHLDMYGKMTSIKANRDKNINLNQKVQNNPVIKSHHDGVMMQNGIMLKVKNGQMTILEDDMTMSNGTRIMSDGTCVHKDGTKMKLKEGQHVDMSGNLNSTKAK